MKRRDSDTSKGLEAFARFGYTAKGIVYALIGILAAMAAFGLGGRTAGATGALRKLAGEPFGQTMLGVLAVGLVGYVIWRFVQGFADPEHKGRGFKGLMTRTGLIISGLFYAGLAVYAVKLLVSAASGGGGGGSAESWTARLMSYRGGLWVVGGIGAVFIGVAAYQAWRGTTKHFKKAWDTPSMSPEQERWATRIGQVGYWARALVFTLIGAFIIVAALTTDPSAARGLGGALDALAEQPYGPWLLGLVGLGLLCYGGYCFVNARFRHINPT